MASRRSGGWARASAVPCASSRIILILDIARAYQRLKRRENKVFKELGGSVSDLMEARLLAPS